jgi:hypothetical protein
VATHSPGKMVLTYKKRRASPGGDTLPREDGTDLQEEESLSWWRHTPPGRWY